MAKRPKNHKRKKQDSRIKPEFIRFKKWVINILALIMVVMQAMPACAEGDTDIFSKEPTIYEVQQEAIKYAEVSPGKIEWMRKAAANKAWLPTLSIGADRNVTDLWHWEGGSTTKVDDDFLRKGRDAIKWDLTLNWDFGKLIWNNDQTDIDIRSQLTARLRNDILNEVTKLYFKRRNLQLELFSDLAKSKEEKFPQQLQLDEVTAHIDALTGGYLSRQIKNRSM